MIKQLRAIGNSLGLIIDKPILDLLKIDSSTELELTTDGHRLIITPVTATARQRPVRDAHARAMKPHDAAFKRPAK